MRLRPAAHPTGANLCLRAEALLRYRSLRVHQPSSASGSALADRRRSVSCCRSACTIARCWNRTHVHHRSRSMSDLLVASRERQCCGPWGWNGRRARGMRCRGTHRGRHRHRLVDRRGSARLATFSRPDVGGGECRPAAPAHRRPGLAVLVTAWTPKSCGVRSRARAHRIPACRGAAADDLIELRTLVQGQRVERSRVDRLWRTRRSSSPSSSFVSKRATSDEARIADRSPANYVSGRKNQRPSTHRVAADDGRDARVSCCLNGRRGGGPATSA